MAEIFTEEEKFEMLKNYVTNINNFSNINYINKYLDYLNQIKNHERNKR
jgi:hypothetical protein